MKLALEGDIRVQPLIVPKDFGCLSEQLMISKRHRVGVSVCIFNVEGLKCVI